MYNVKWWIAMRKLVALDKDYTIKLKSDICAGIAPDLIFLPIDTASINLKLNQKINMGEQISAERVSPVSGTVKGLKYCTINGGVKKKCLVIENDLEEKRLKPVSSRKKLTNLTQQEFIENAVKDFILKNLDLIIKKENKENKGLK